MNWTEVTRLQGPSRVESQLVVDGVVPGRFFTIWQLDGSAGCLVFQRQKTPHGRHRFVSVRKDARRCRDIVTALRSGAGLFTEAGETP